MSAGTRLQNIAVIVLLMGGVVQSETVAVKGVVHARASDGPALAVPGVRVTLTCDGQAPITVVSDEQGGFRFGLPKHSSIGNCSLETDVQGFKPAMTSFHSAAADPLDLSVSLEHETLYTGLLVTTSRPNRGVRCDRQQDASHVVTGESCEPARYSNGTDCVFIGSQASTAQKANVPLSLVP